MRLRDATRFLARLLVPHRAALGRLAAWSALEAAPMFGSGLAIAAALDRGFLAGRPLVGLAWLAVLAALWTAGALATRRVYPWLAGTVEPLRDALVTALVEATMHRAVSGGGADGASVTQATVQVETVRALVSALLRNMRQLAGAGVAALGGLAVLSPVLALVVGGCVALAVALFVGLLRVLFVRYRDVVLREEQVTALAGPVVTGVRDVVVAAAEERAAGQVGAAIEAEAAAGRAFALARAWRLPVVILGAHLPLVALLALAPSLLADGRLTTGQLVGGVYYLFTGLEPAIQLLVNAAGSIVVSLAVVLNRLAEACTGGPAPTAAAGLTPSGHDLVLDDVTFAYSPRADPVIRELTLDLPAGLHLAVVGPSGVGKSTLANLLAGLAAPQRGRVSFGGLAMEQVDETHLRREVALIPQEAYVFAGTVRENLGYLRPGAGDAELDEAVAAVGAEQLIARLGGYDGVLEPGGGGLSPGERQLVALARTYLAPAGLVVLDEATCHLDPPAELRAEAAFTRRPGTLVVIAHRMSSALRADRVLVLDGAEARIGTHAELLDDSPLYAELVGRWST